MPHIASRETHSVEESQCVQRSLLLSALLWAVAVDGGTRLWLQHRYSVGSKGQVWPLREGIRNYGAAGSSLELFDVITGGLLRWLFGEIQL